MLFITLTLAAEHAVETAIRVDQFVQLTPHLHVDRPHAKPKAIGTDVRLLDGAVIHVRESVSTIWDRVEEQERRGLGIQIEGSMVDPDAVAEMLLGQPRKDV